VAILNMFGMTELGAATACRRDDPPEVRHTTVGRPIPGYEVRIAGAGEVQVRGPHVMRGYHRRPAETAAAFEDGWLRTGDLGTLDAAGNLRISGRAKELVHVGGFNVFPAEVEALLLTHPDVAGAGVVGVPDERMGEALRAYVVPRPGAALTARDVIAWARARAAGYKVPYRVEVVEQLPLLASGKVDRTALAREAGVARA
jgi:acyl-CoA synthetase (AMP-forming)/AMP-acid ligase II